MANDKPHNTAKQQGSPPTKDAALLRQLALQARGNIALQMGAFVTGEQLDSERADVLALNFDDAAKRA